MNLLKPKYAILVVFLAAFSIDLSMEKWERDEGVIAHDIHSYYFYLPAFFIYDDIKLEKSNYSYADDRYFFWNQPDKNGDKVAKMTCGLALLYSPFFFVAHTVALYTQHPQNGFSAPYKVLLLLSALFYLILGLDFLKRTLRLFEFKESTIALTILLIGLATNLLAYASQAAPMPHIYGFTLFAGFAYNTIKWYNSYSIKRTLYLGLLFGLITLIRPSNGLIVLFFIFYGINTFEGLKERLFLFKKKFGILLLVLPLTVLVWSPQLMYWKEVSGKLIYYSYREEGFYFLAPRLFQGFFSFRKGWLIYTPIMAFAIVGFFFIKEKVKDARVPLVVFSVLNVYVIFSWWCWWYGGTYGMRTMIESYALLAIPFAAFLTWINQRNLAAKIVFYAVSLFFVWLNIFQTYQFENKSLHHDAMSAELYFKQFGKLDKIKNFDSYLKYIGYKSNKYRNGEPKPEENEENTSLGKKVNILAENGMYLCTEWHRGVVADKSEASGWEEFFLLELEDNHIALMAYDNLYVSTDIGSNGAVASDKPALDNWGKLEMIALDSGFVAFKAQDGKFWTVGDNFALSAASDSLSGAGKFKITYLN